MYSVFNACNMVISDRKVHGFTWWCSHGLNLMAGRFESTGQLNNESRSNHLGDLAYFKDLFERKNFKSSTHGRTFENFTRTSCMIGGRK